MAKDRRGGKRANSIEREMAITAPSTGGVNRIQKSDINSFVKNNQASKFLGTPPEKLTVKGTEFKLYGRPIEQGNKYISMYTSSQKKNSTGLPIMLNVVVKVTGNKRQRISFDMDKTLGTGFSGLY